MNKHTPGPWYALEVGPYIHIQNGPHYEDLDLLDEECQEVVANAKLMASAPDLLEALQMLVNEFSDMSVQMKTPIAYYKGFNKASEAIKKATK